MEDRAPRQPDDGSRESGEIRVRVKRFIVWRTLVAFFLLILALALERGFGRTLSAILPLFWVVSLTFLATILYGLLFPRMGHLTSFVYLQISVDLLLETALIFSTGGIESPFIFLYMVTIMAATAVLSRRDGLLTSSLAAILFGGLVDLQFYGYLPVQPSDLPSLEIFYRLFLDILGFFLISLLAGNLAHRLKETKERLREQGQELEEFRALHQNIVRSISDGLLTTDMEGRLTSFNRAAEKITGLRRDEVKGKTWSEVFGERQLEEVLRGTHLLRKAPSRFEMEFIQRNGVQILGMTVFPLKDERGRLSGLVAIFQDLTEKKTKEVVRARREQLAVVGELAAGMAHEIRNPLAALSGAMQVLSRDLALEDGQRDLMQIALKETGRLDSLVTDFLRYARPKPLAKKRCDLHRLIHETLSLLRNSSHFPPHVEISTDLHKGRMTAMVDPDQIKQVLWNLAENAVQAMPSGGRLTVSTRIEKETGMKRGHTLQIIFHDTGEGLTEEDRQRIFTPFWTTKTGGSGLGLTIVQRIIEEHEGWITIDSEPGKGTSFTILLPSPALFLTRPLRAPGNL